MNSEVFVGNGIRSYSSKSFTTHWTALDNADGQWSEAYCESSQSVFFFFTERKMSKGHAETENSYSITKDKTQIQHLMMFVGSRLQVDIVFKGFATKY